jgi:MFS family permease
VLLVIAAVGSTLFAVSDHFWIFLIGRALIDLGVASAMTAGLKALVLWFPGNRVPFLNGLMVMLGALGAVTAALPADLLLDWIGWRELFGLFAVLTAASAVLNYGVYISPIGYFTSYQLVITAAVAGAPGMDGSEVAERTDAGSRAGLESADGALPNRRCQGAGVHPANLASPKTSI